MNTNIRTIKDIFETLNYPIKFSDTFVEDFYLILTDNGFLNYIDDESIFYSSQYAKIENFSFGEIVIEFSNTIKDAEKIITLFDNLIKTYTFPTLQFAIDIYSNFRNMGYSDLVTRSILYGILYQLCINKTLSEFNAREYFYYEVVINPLNIISQTHYVDEVKATVEFWEDSHGLTQICYSNLENYSLKNLDAIYARKNNVHFHQCIFCNRYFIETNKNNTKYCPLCRNIHSDFKSDAFRLEYRKAYKTMQQRAKRHELKGGNFNYYIITYCNPFEKEAKEKENIYRMQNDLNGYINFLNQLKQKYREIR